ncbi:Slit-like 1 protein [Holothuria leucospilota]|uniref:Slit-like 1 protein n=1 Tax=Holothuria leucospilota TaxID=206669 RepID=A0A9Q1CU18_HOLLE|nr:Slit-like 1 protein [Holothuria leucospilota]
MYNGIVQLPGPSTDTGLIQRSLTNGTIKEIPEGYFRHLHLEIIDLRNNQLTTFNISSFAYTTGPRTIYLSGNKVVCDSNIDWLQKWKSLHPTNMVNGDCTGSGETINTYLCNYMFY